MQLQDEFLMYIMTLGIGSYLKGKITVTSAFIICFQFFVVNVDAFRIVSECFMLVQYIYTSIAFFIYGCLKHAAIACVTNENVIDALEA